MSPGQSHGMIEGGNMKRFILLCLLLIAAPHAALGKIVNTYSIGNWSVVVHAA
jgi:hypothetical protein